jgi:hypothetical protein
MQAAHACAIELRSALQVGLSNAAGMEVLAVMPLLEQAASLVNQLSLFMTMLEETDRDVEEGSL